MKTFGTLQYAIDKYSGSWTWKITGVRAVNDGFKAHTGVMVWQWS